jgi:ABC-type tungstate transport system permease subunit
MMSGGPIQGFRRGWAVRIVFSSTPHKAHYYERDELGMADALCGAHSARVATLRDIGTWTKCRRCEAVLSKQQAKIQK